MAECNDSVGEDGRIEVGIGIDLGDMVEEADPELAATRAFFDREDNYRRGVRWYEQQFDGARGHRAIGEKTPAYCFVPVVPERINYHLPGVKLIWILRDPVARAYSNYWHHWRSGNERASFETAIERGLEEERATGQKNCEYLDKGCYAEQVRRYLEFSRESGCSSSCSRSCSAIPSRLCA